MTIFSNCDLTEAVQKIKSVGSEAVRCVPMEGQDVVSGKYQIEVNVGGRWQSVVSGISQPAAMNIISQATNRVICG